MYVVYVHTRERDIRPGFDGVKIKFYLFIIIIIYNKYAPFLSYSVSIWRIVEAPIAVKNVTLGGANSHATSRCGRDLADLSSGSC